MIKYVFCFDILNKLLNANYNIKKKKYIYLNTLFIIFKIREKKL